MVWAVVVAFAVLAAASVWLTVIDIREHRLPNRIVLGVAVTGLALLAVTVLLTGRWMTLVGGVACGAVLFAFYAALHLVGGGVGAGDVKLAGALGLFLGFVGWQTAMVATVVTFLAGGVWALGLIATRRAGRRTRIAFGPFLLLGAWVAIAAHAWGG